MGGRARVKQARKEGRLTVMVGSGSTFPGTLGRAAHLADAVAVVAVDEEHDTLAVDEVVAPQRADLVAPAHLRRAQLVNREA